MLLPTNAPSPRRRPARRRRIAARRAVAFAVLAGTLVVPASGAAGPMPARSAAEFRDSIGVQTHFPFTGYAYDAAPTTQLAEMLRTVGIRHLRDDTCFNTEPACQRVRARMAAVRDAFGPGGPKVDLLALYSRELAAVKDRGTRDAEIERGLTAASSAPLAEMIAGLEPVNEPDLKDSGDWTSSTLADHATFQRLLSQQRFAALRTLPHLSPAIGHAANTPALLASGWTRDRADYGNFHPYPAAWGGPEHALQTACGTTDALGCVGQLGRAAAPIATESGYSTSGNVLSTNWVSERAQSIYLPRLVLENFRRGIARTYLYELVDLKPTRGAAVDGYGLWRAKAVGSQFLPADPKPAALALARMNATIGDLGAASTSGQLDVAVRVDGRDASEDVIRRVLLRRANGSYVLALWQPKTVWDNAVFRQADRTVDDLPATVGVGGTDWTMQATRPTASDQAVGRWSATRSVVVPVGADVTLIDLVPGGPIDGSRAPGDEAPPRPATPAPPASTPPAPSNAARTRAAASAEIARIMTAALRAIQRAHAAKARADRARSGKSSGRASRAKQSRSKQARAKHARAKHSRTR